MAAGERGRLIARTSDRLITDFTREERCAMYEYVIANTVEPDIGDDIADMNKAKSSYDGKTSSYLELLAQERNLKRRRAKYRGVHTNKKSHIEIVREIVNQQMEMLTEYISENRVEDSNISKNDLSSGDNLSRIGDFTESLEKRNCKELKDDNREIDKKSSNDHKRSTDDRRYDFPKDNDFHDRPEKVEKNRSRERSGYDVRERRDSSDRKSHKSSERKSHKSSHKKHRHKSKNRHDRTDDSHNREKSRSSKNSKHYDRRPEVTSRSTYDDRSTRRRRSRSR